MFKHTKEVKEGIKIIKDCGNVKEKKRFVKRIK